MGDRAVFLLVDSDVLVRRSGGERVVEPVSGRSIWTGLFDDRTAPSDSSVVREVRCLVSRDYREG